MKKIFIITYTTLSVSSTQWINLRGDTCYHLPNVVEESKEVITRDSLRVSKILKAYPKAKVDTLLICN